MDMVEDWLTELEEYKRLEAEGMLVRLPCPIGSTLYRIDSKTRFCSYHHNTRDNMYYCIEDYRCKHICDGKCNAGIDYHIYEIHNADAKVILGNKDYIGTRVFLTKEEAERELTKKQEKERYFMAKASQEFDHPYAAYYCDYLNNDDDE